MNDAFVLHEQLAEDTVEIARWRLSLVLLMNERRWPWLILVPRRPQLRELHQLARPDAHRLIDEVAAASQRLEDMFHPAKINVGALGNRVPQLHLHVVARCADDPAWPGPVWGFGPRLAYEAQDLAARREALRRVLAAA